MEERSLCGHFFMNELLLLLSVAVIYGAVLLSYKFYGRSGLYAMTVFCTIVANIEVLLVVDAFALTQTLGNVLFAATFLITDILNENHGKKDANKAVVFGMLTSLLFIIISQSWMLYITVEENTVAIAIREVFSFAPRTMLSSLAVYAISQFADVYLYCHIWGLTEKRTGSSRSHLWLRNNLATLISQLINTVLFNLFAFGGIYSAKTLISIMLSGYIITVFTSLLDTPCVYIARKMSDKRK